MGGDGVEKILLLPAGVFLHALAALSLLARERVLAVAALFGPLAVHDEDAVGVAGAVVPVAALPLVRLLVEDHLAALALLDALLLGELLPLGHGLLLRREGLGAGEGGGAGGELDVAAVHVGLAREGEEVRHETLKHVATAREARHGGTRAAVRAELGGVDGGRIRRGQVAEVQIERTLERPGGLKSGGDAHTPGILGHDGGDTDSKSARRRRV